MIGVTAREANEAVRNGETVKEDVIVILEEERFSREAERVAFRPRNDMMVY